MTFSHVCVCNRMHVSTNVEEREGEKQVFNFKKMYQFDQRVCHQFFNVEICGL